jgi:tRNA pseudouridine55 synthase
MNSDTRVRTDGLLLIDKPTGMTSHDVVAAIRKLVRPLRVGHTGTLDPLAEGLLIICVGEATRIAGFIEAQRKLYRTVALLGTQTDTQDITGKPISTTPADTVTEAGIREAASAFLGEIEQTPPAFSAIKVGGVRAYKLARRQEDVQLEPRKVNIMRFEIERVRLPRVELLIECSKGTYVRTLCNDLGTALGVGGCMESLRRLAIGEFNVEDAVPLAAMNSRKRIMESLLPASRGLTHMPAVSCTNEQAMKLSHGMALTVTGQVALPEGETQWAQALGPDEELMAVGHLTRDGDTVNFHPKRVLASAGVRT